MPLDGNPATADNIIKFDGTPGRAAKLNYSVPLPGRFVGRRSILAELGIADGDWLGTAKTAGTDLSRELELQEISEGTYTYNTAKAVNYWLEKARASGVPGDQIAVAERLAAEDFLLMATPIRSPEELGAEDGPEIPSEEPPGPRMLGYLRSRRFGISGTGIEGGEMPGGTPPIGITPYPDDGGEVPDAYLHLVDFLNKLQHGVLSMPQGEWGGGVSSTPVTPSAPATPALFLVEVYGISSFLGDYGLGRTVRTFTLLPGESTTISLKTWRSTEAKEAESSSVIDSFQKSAADKFRTAVQRETMDKSTRSETSKWHVEASAGLDLAIVKANVSAGGGGEYHSGQEEFAKQLSECVQEHANEASAKRELSVTSSSERTEKAGEETAVERTIRNVNYRRTLNFVFRELNQEYITKIHLKEIRIAFTNGRADTWREVPLSGLRTLLREVLVPGKVDEIAKAILKAVAVVFDATDQPIPVLETFTMSSDGQNWTRGSATLSPTGDYPAPSDTMFYRFRRGALGQDQSPNPVDGVLLKERSIVLRTDSVVVEALLGQADALDPYAMESQRAEAEAKTLQNARESLAQEDLEQILDPLQRATAFAEMFRPEEEQLKVELVESDGA